MKRLLGYLVLLCMLLMATSCSTTVAVHHLMPAEVDLCNARNLALIPTKAYRFPYGRPLSPWIDGLQETSFTLTSGYSLVLAEQVATRSDDLLYDALQDTLFFSILPLDRADLYFPAACKGIDAVFSSEISYMDVEESVVVRDVIDYVTEDPDLSDSDPTVHTMERVVGREYYLVQKATLGLTYTMVEASSNRLLVSHTFTGKKQQETKVGERTYDLVNNGAFRDKRTYASGYAPSFLPLFEEILSSFADSIAGELAPTWETTYLSLLKNKPKLEQAKIGYTLTEQGEYQRAYEHFLSLWQTTRHLPSGYNAALLLQALGRFSQAVDLMNDVYNETGSPKAHDGLLLLQEQRSAHEKAQRQISGEEFSDGQGVTMTNYMVME